jgi:glutamate dehydrogenase
MADDHFTFLGYREYDLGDEQDGPVLRSRKDTGLALLRGDDAGHVSTSFAALPREVRELAREPTLLVVTKANSRSTVHRPGYMDYVGVKRIDAEGRVTGEHRFIGLYTSGAYNRNPSVIPLLSGKVQRVLARAGYPPNSHASKALLHTLETFPRDLLFQLDDEQLHDTATGILQLQERQRIALFVTRDRFMRFFSCIVFVPRDRFNTQGRMAIEDILAEAFGAIDVDFTVLLSESILARLHFVFRVEPGATPEYDVDELEDRLRAATRAWSDELYIALLEHFGEEQGTRLFRRYGEAFRADYRESYVARLAVPDIERMETLDEEGGRDLAMSLYRPLEGEEDELRFRLFRLGRAVSLSDALPMLENMGLRVEDERPSKVKRAAGPRAWLHDFGLRHSEPHGFDLDRVREKFQEVFASMWRGESENDGFNRLVLRAGLGHRDIIVLRACCKYLRQTTVSFSQAYMEEALSENPGIARLLVELFHVLHDPAGGDAEARGQGAAALVESIQAALDDVANLDQDRILRSFLGLIRATLRTNHYQTDDAGRPKPYLSLKFDPRRIPELPEPRPMFEIFVYSPRVEGVHLRGGPVARGGLRWSDRREDFRTEVLGLVKAQMVKNAVIVPVGSKGGFFPKRLPVGGDREAVLAEGIACYRTFICGLLDLTDNLVGGRVVPPAQVFRHDGDDPYLVVAADKGTATFSDIANELAIEYGFWLGDAFASGGSQGYDHKGMGITARGAWESVKRHFRELGLDTQATDFTVVGIGDMAGDVFGNGLLLSEHIGLVGAFNHMHVFLDPDPDPARSFAERRRLFELPRSSWDDYDRSLISEGGGVFARSAKSIPLSPQVRERLGVEHERLTPNELIRALLRAPVDLLWNGGIGTYVKATDEHDDEVGDRANDGVRVNASELRCRVVGEGGNLGLTQRGRIEFARAGGRVNSDAIDNAGGVNCSDHEVNIKILLNGVVAAGDMTEKQRNALLVDMTDQVGELVLRDNYLQTQALGLAGYQAAGLLDVHRRLMRRLEREGELDRAIEYLPFDAAIARRLAAGEGLTAPELSVLMAYVKIGLFQDLLDSDITGDACALVELQRYFPTQIRAGFGEAVSGHQLSAEIIATVLANEIVNRSGMTYMFRLCEETGATPADVARAYLAARDVFGMPAVWSQIEALDNRTPARVQIDALLEGRKLVERAARWLLRNRPSPLDVAAICDQFSGPVEALADALPDLVDDGTGQAIEAAARRRMDDGVPEALARRVAVFPELFSGLDLVQVATAAQRDAVEVASIYFSLGAKLGLHWMLDRIVELPRETRWHTLARAAMRDDFYAQLSTLTADVLRAGKAADGPDARIEAWLSANATAVARCGSVLADLEAAGSPDFTMLSVAMREVRALHRPEDAPGSVAPALTGDPVKVKRKARSKGRAA